MKMAQYSGVSDFYNLNTQNYWNVLERLTPENLWMNIDTKEDNSASTKNTDSSKELYVNTQSLDSTLCSDDEYPRESENRTAADASDNPVTSKHTVCSVPTLITERKHISVFENLIETYRYEPFELFLNFAVNALEQAIDHQDKEELCLENNYIGLVIYKYLNTLCPFQIIDKFENNEAALKKRIKLIQRCRTLNNRLDYFKNKPHVHSTHNLDNILKQTQNLLTSELTGTVVDNIEEPSWDCYLNNYYEVSEVGETHYERNIQYPIRYYLCDIAKKYTGIAGTVYGYEDERCTEHYSFEQLNKKVKETGKFSLAYEREFLYICDQFVRKTFNGRTDDNEQEILFFFGNYLHLVMKAAENGIQIWSNLLRVINKIRISALLRDPGTHLIIYDLCWSIDYIQRLWRKLPSTLQYGYRITIDYKLVLVKLLILTEHQKFGCISKWKDSYLDSDYYDCQEVNGIDLDIDFTIIQNNLDMNRPNHLDKRYELDYFNYVDLWMENTNILNSTQIDHQQSTPLTGSLSPIRPSHQATEQLSIHHQ